MSMLGKSKSSRSGSKKRTPEDPLRTSTHTARKHILGENTKFVITEAYKLARTNIMFSLSSSQNKVIAVTSSNPAEAKTTTTVNLAITFAMTGAKVLLIDGDMRKPFIHKLFKLDKNIGLSMVLGGMCTVAEAIHSNIRDNLDVIAAGPIPPNPVELLGSDNMKQLLEILGSHYDYIFVDMPPVNVVSDALLLSPMAAGFVLIIRDGFTKYSDVQLALSQINMAGGKVLGFIKTVCRAKGGGKYYGRYYGSKYKYGYSSYYGENEPSSEQH